MKKLLLLWSLCLLGGIPQVSAQQKFVERLEKNVSGQGTVHVHQDDEITRLVNGKSADVPTEGKGIVGNAGQNRPADEDDAPPTVNRPVRKMKATGYRIQVYAGGNSRTARQEAQRMAGKVREYFRDMPTYTHFQSPRWICRVGDFRTYEEASQALHEMRATRQFDEALIVKSVILIPY